MRSEDLNEYAARINSINLAMIIGKIKPLQVSVYFFSKLEVHILVLVSELSYQPG
jgi:hypothetical protein